LWKDRFFGGETALNTFGDDATRCDDNLRLMTTSWKTAMPMTAERMTQHVVMTPSVMTAKPMTSVRMTLRDAD
jgi:hypothetical protein